MVSETAAQGRLWIVLASLLLLTACVPAAKPNAPVEAVVVTTSQPAPAADAVRVEPSPAVVEPGAVAPAPAAVPESEVAAPAVPELAHGADVFARIRKGLRPNACEAGSNSTRWRKRYAGHPESFARHLEQALPLLDFVSIEVERSGLPMEFVFVPLVESWYRPDAIGPGGPAGMWQMISSTARNHGIHITNGYDGRLSPVESTRAALSYLKVLQGMFGDWEAIVMAYNAGEGRLLNAFKRARSREASAAARRPHGLSNITYDYVAKLQALSCLVSEPGRSGLDLPVAARFVPVAAVPADPEYGSVEQYARSHGLDASTLRRLNPGYKSGRIVAGVPRLLLVPTLGGSPVALPVEEPAQVEPDADAEPVDPQTVRFHEVKAGDTLWSIARRYGISVDSLRQLNRIGSRTLVRPGQKLRLAP